MQRSDSMQGGKSHLASWHMAVPRRQALLQRAVESLESRRLLDGSGLTAQFFNTTDLTGAPVTRIDANVNFDWGIGAPDNSLNPDNYTARWTGKVQAAYSQTYTFSLNVTGGARLWVNNVQIINQWSATGTNTFTCTIALTAGTKYDIKLEYAEKTGNAAVALSWSSASQAQQIIPKSALYSWTDADMGSTGSSSYNSATDTWTLAGSGNNWLSSSDSGHVIYQQMTGDVDLVMRINSVSSSSMYTGLFVRNSLSANSAGGMIEVNGLSIWSAARLTAGTNVTGSSSGLDATAGTWLRLIRKGTSITGYFSVDGSNWIGMWGRTVTLNDTIYVGAFASSGGGSQATASFTNFSATNYNPDFDTSWIGNTQNGAGAWVQNDLKGMYVEASTGMVFVNSIWDEGGHEAAVYQNGQMIAGIEGQHGWGRSGGWAIVADANYIYVTMSQGNPGWSEPANYPESGSWWNCIRRYSRVNYQPAGWTGGSAYDSSMLIVNTSGSSLTGLAIIGNNLYISDPTNNTIKIYNKTTMTLTGSFSVPRPGQLTVDGSNNLWVVSYADASNAAKILCYSSTGTKLSPEITGVVSPMGIGYNPATGQLLVTDDGPRQQILKYSNLTSAAPTLAGTLGDYGGISSGVAGQVTPTKFDNPMAVGADASGNIYVGFQGTSGDYNNVSKIGLGAVVRSFNSSGTLNWQLYGLEFVDSAALDPTTDGLNIYTKDERFTIDYSATGGNIGTWASRTVDEFTNSDSRLSGDNTSVWVKQIAGQTFMFGTGQGGMLLTIYKKVAGTDLWQACGTIREPALNGTAKASIWRDTNNDGIQQTSEVTFTNVAAKEDGFGFDIDSQGNIWSIGYYSGLRKYSFSGLDANGIPIYSSTVTTPNKTTIFNQLGRAAYDAATDTMYLSGWTNANPIGSGDWGIAGSTIARYNNWSTTPSLAWSTVMQYTPGDFDVAKAISLAGNRLFVAFASTGTVRAYNTSTGALVEVLFRGPEIGGYGGWLDTSQPMQAFRRSNGQYVITVEDDLLAKVTVITAGGITPTNLHSSVDLSGVVTLAWDNNNTDESGYVIQRSTNGTTYSDYVTLPANMTSYLASDLQPGSTYYFRIKATNSFDDSPWSTALTVAVPFNPNAPSNLTATPVTANRVDLSWTDTTSNETGFVLERATNSGFTAGLVSFNIAANATSYSDTSVAGVTTYFYRVSSRSGATVLGYSGVATVSTPDAPPAAPSAMTATTLSGGSIRITWTDNSANESNFIVDRSTSFNFSSNVVTSTLAANQISFVATGLLPLTTYYFRVRAINSGGYSTYATSVSATTTEVTLGIFAAQTDIGNPVLAGSSDYSGVTDSYAMTGAGTDIWDTSDQFQYLYTTLSGNGQLIAHVDSLDNTNSWAKAGVMIRQSLDAGSTHATMAITPGNGAAFQYRSSTNGITSSVAGAAVAAPYWVRMTRQGDVLTGYTSSDGVNWAMVGQTTIAMGSQVYIGLAVTSHNTGAITNASVSQVSLINTVPIAPSSLVAQVVSTSQVNLSWADNAIGESGYILARATNAIFTTGLTQISIAANATSYSDTGLTENTTYYYRIHAYNVIGDSSNSSTVSAQTSAPVISGVVFNDLNGDGIKQAGESGLAGQSVYLDLNNNGVLEMSSTSTFSSSGSPIAIADYSGGSKTTTSTINVTGLTSIADLNVGINIAHTSDRDLYIYLLSPTGTRIQLFNRSGGSSDNIGSFTGNGTSAVPVIYTLFDDSAATAVSSGTAPFTANAVNNLASYRPTAALSGFNGENPNGTWTLQVVDSRSGNTGYINVWKLFVATTGDISTTTDASGNYTLTPSAAGTYAVRTSVTGVYANTIPANGLLNAVTAYGTPTTGQNFGLAAPQTAAPTGITLAAASDTGVAADNLTNLNNSAAGKALSFNVTGTVAGATVYLYADGNLIGQAVATGTTTLVTTNGSTTLTDGSHTFTAKQQSGSAAISNATSAATVTIDTVPPKVSAVLASSSAWAASFLSYLSSNGKGVGGYQISGANQSRTLPWNNINQLKINFSEDVNVIQSSLSLRGTNIANYLTNAFAYSSANKQAVWTLASALGADRLLADLTDGVTDAAGNALDGDWTTGQTVASGNGVAGGHMLFRFNSLPGDTDGNGVILSNDVNAVRLNQFTTASTGGNYSIFNDIDGSGVILSNDVNAVRLLQFTLLPANQPS